MNDDPLTESGLFLSRFYILGEKMKFLLLSLLLLPFYSLASTKIECVQAKGWETNEMFVKASLAAKLEILSNKNVLLQNLTLSYSIHDDKLSSYAWSEGQSHFTSVNNNPNYTPRKYLNYFQFQTYISSHDSLGYGYIDILLPKEAIMTQQESFNAYLQMTGMDDHFGGTIKIYCRLL
tara:strand:+ start:139 stop:672 length:534 start_codon:yes stop_codon:yes gene_type:complete